VSNLGEIPPRATRTNAERWSEQLERDGYVDFQRGGGAVGFVLMFVVFPPVFAYLGWQGVFDDEYSRRSIGPVGSVALATIMVVLGAPVTLEAVLSRGPALRVDRDGLQIAGWPRWCIAWDELVASDLGRSRWGGSANTVRVAPGVMERHRERQFVLLRWIHGVNGQCRGEDLRLWRVYYPSVEQILKWLDTEIAKRVEAPRAKHSPAWYSRQSLGLLSERHAERTEQSRERSRRSKRRKRRLKR
jgi:hypothetical protein